MCCYPTYSIVAWVCFGVGVEELEGKQTGPDGVRDGKGRRRGHTMTSPPSYAATSWSGVASPQKQRQHEAVGVEDEEDTTPSARLSRTSPIPTIAYPYLLSYHYA